ncbi:MAG: hypothetical protein K2X81_25405, partial [Candidatus Obscuribacterales bacterium]|nr:hypothetical protein [Candidatus Obscuribacterales bacterium]
LAARVQGRFRQFAKRVNQNLLAVTVGLLLFVSCAGLLIYFNPDCRRFVHTSLNPSVYAICLMCGRLTENYNFQLAKWFFNRAVREADFGKVTDNQINSRDELQMLYLEHAYRADSKRVDAQIKSLKSEWLVRRFSIKMRDEDNAFIDLLSQMKIPSAQSDASKMANSLNRLAEKSLKRGAYKLAAKQAQKALDIYEDLHDLSTTRLRCLATLEAAFEQAGELTKSAEVSRKILALCSSTPSSLRFERSAQISLARVALMQGRSAEAEEWYKTIIDASSKEGAAGIPQLKDALSDYAAFLRRFNRDAEASTIETRLNSLESPLDAQPTADRTHR